MREPSTTTRGDATAGMSGIKGTDGDLPAFWAGGTYNDALSGTAKAIIRHDGSGSIAAGNFSWDINGEVLFGKDFADKKITISPTATIPSLAEINNKEKYTADDFAFEEGVDLNDPSQAPFVRTKEHTVEFEIKNSFKFIDNTWVCIYSYFSSDVSVITNEIFLSFERKNSNGGWDTISQATDADIDEGGYTKLTLPETDCNPGIYRFFMSYSWSAETIGPNAHVYFKINSIIKYQLRIKKLTIASDGIAFSDSNSDNFFRLSLQDTIPFRYHGNTDIPGVLLAGEVSTAGGFSSVWGAKGHASKTGEKIATGQYKVWHSIGHLEYQVQITPTTENRSCCVVGKNTDNFLVYFYSIGSSPTLADTGFHFSITGKNYV